MSNLTPDSERISQLISEMLTFPKKTTEEFIPICKSLLVGIGEFLNQLKFVPGKDKEKEVNGKGGLADSGELGKKDGETSSVNPVKKPLKDGNSTVLDSADWEGTGLNVAENVNTSLEFIVDGKSAVKLTSYSLDNNLSHVDSQKLGLLLSLPTGTVLPDHLRVPIVEGYYYDEEGNKKMVFFVKPGEPMRNPLQNINVSPGLKASFEAMKNGRAVAQEPPVATSVNRMFCSGLTNQASAQNLRRWALGNLISPFSWFNGLRHLSQKLSQSKYSLVRMGGEREAQFQNLIGNVQNLITAFGSRDLRIRQLATPPYAFYHHQPNAIWDCHTLQMGNCYSLNYSTSADLPGKYQITLTDVNDQVIYSVLYDKQAKIGYTRNTSTNRYERRLINSLLEPGISANLSKYNQTTTLEQRDVVVWLDNGRLMRSQLGKLAKAVHATPHMLNFMPERFKVILRSVYQTALANTSRSLLSIAKHTDKKPVFRLADPTDYLRQFEVDLSQPGNLKIYSVPLDNQGRSQDQEKQLLFFGDSSPAIGSGVQFQESHFRLLDLIGLNDLVYSKFVNTVVAKTDLDPQYMKANAGVVDAGNCLLKIQDGSLEFLDISQYPVEFTPDISPLQEEITAFQNKFSENLRAVYTNHTEVTDSKKHEVNPQPELTRKNETEFSDVSIEPDSDLPLQENLTFLHEIAQTPKSDNFIDQNLSTKNVGSKSSLDVEVSDPQNLVSAKSKVNETTTSIISESLSFVNKIIAGNVLYKAPSSRSKSIEPEPELQYGDKLET